MRVNIYAEELTDRVEVISKNIDGQVFTGLRFWLELPVTMSERVAPGSIYMRDKQIRGPFIHHPGDDDSSAVTFWGKQDLRKLLSVAQQKLADYYGEHPKGEGGSHE